jgi:hypothetical protein
MSSFASRASLASLGLSLAMASVSPVAAADVPPPASTVAPALASTGTAPTGDVMTRTTQSAATAASAAAMSKALAATGATPSFQSLPAGHVAPMPSSRAPDHVAAGQSVRGFVVVAPPPEQARALQQNQSGMAYLFSTAARAKAQLGGNVTPDDPATQTCFVDGGNALQEEEGDSARSSTPAPSIAWPAQATSMETFSFPFSGRGAVHPMHAERLSVDGHGHATLDSTDVWLDAQTHGVKLIGRGRMTLQRVYVGPNDLEIYAARDGAGLQVVVRAATSPVEGASAAARVASEIGTISMTLPGGSNASSDCGHVRFELHPEAGQGEMATLQSVALLPPLPGDEPVMPPVEVPSPDALAAMRVQAMRRRPFQLSVSASESSSDETPVVSVAVGWLGRERRNGS